VAAEIAKLKSPLIRPTDPGVVVVLRGGELQPGIMRWGFTRSFSKAINNTRAESLGSSTWKQAFRSSRCLVPMSTFYEWKNEPGRTKQAYEFKLPREEWLWVAGIFEHKPPQGDAYSTITTTPSPLMAPIHNRMLAVMPFQDGLAFLRGEISEFSPYAGELSITPCESPLKRKPTAPPGDGSRGILREAGQDDEGNHRRFRKT